MGRKILIISHCFLIRYLFRNFGTGVYQLQESYQMNRESRVGQAKRGPTLLYARYWWVRATLDPPYSQDMFFHAKPPFNPPHEKIFADSSCQNLGIGIRMKVSEAIALVECRQLRVEKRTMRSWPSEGRAPRRIAKTLAHRRVIFIYTGSGQKCDKFCLEEDLSLQ
jgi:hypothetical protein